MSLPPAALQKLLQEVESQALQSQQKISQTQAELSQTRRDARLTQLTLTELSTLPPQTPIYEGLGKIFVGADLKSVREKIGKEGEGKKKEIKALEGRLVYQETTFKNSRSAMERILQSGGR